MGNAELQVFLLPHPAPAIGAGERKAPRIAVVGAAAMPERAVEQHHAAGRHGRGDGVVVPAVFRRGIIFVAARHDPRRAVVVAEIRQRPDRIDGDRDVRTRQRNQLRVFVDRLRLLARAEHQRAERRQQALLVEHALDHRQHVVVQRHFPEQIVIGQEIVDADGLETFERGFGGAEMCSRSMRCSAASIPRPVRGSAARFDHGVSVVADPVGMRLNLASVSMSSPRSTLCRVFTAA